ncbi:transglutaminase-like cysteine peptidase [Oceanospirillum sediminis]|uniref:Transglutaminase-like cysteine peptidase n=1 Tax=Oceanospirillum sediminis TaxID=2760088 RepID=A0A839IW76_9GAMM|nr:transglutaminase-like cysteine peptidase [Oceanospirillum sediminis]MBB1489208.1 transglutaminase-like cysteine peptidase [Oceanospirillum sediminis]
MLQVLIAGILTVLSFTVSASHSSATLPQLITQTNQYFNTRIQYIQESRDHWLRLAELLNSGKGDCEDFALSKYQALLNQGMPQTAFSFVYAMQKQTGQAHIALLYKPDNIVLDIITDQLLPLKERNDLLPVLEFTSVSYQLFEGQPLLSRGQFNTLLQWQKVVYRAERDITG